MRKETHEISFIGTVSEAIKNTTGKIHDNITYIEYLIGMGFMMDL